MLDLVSSILMGGGTGLIGTAVTGALDFFRRRQTHRHELELRETDLRIVRAEAESAERIAAVEAESVETAAAWSALEGSYEEAGRRWSRGDSGWIVFVDVVRGLTRPGLTWSFVALTGYVYFFLGATEATLRGRIVETILYLTTTTVTWWFGARQLSKSTK